MNTALSVNVSTEELANLLGVDARTIRNLSLKGVITKVGRGQFPLSASIQAIVADAKRQAVPRPEAERKAQLLAAKTEEIALRTATRKRDLIPMEEALAAVSNICALIRENIDGLPRRVTRDLAMQRKIEEAVDDVLDRTSRRCERLAEVLAIGGDPADAQ